MVTTPRQTKRHKKLDVPLPKTPILVQPTLKLAEILQKMNYARKLLGTANLRKRYIAQLDDPRSKYDKEELKDLIAEKDLNMLIAFGKLTRVIDSTLRNLASQQVKVKQSVASKLMDLLFGVEDINISKLLSVTASELGIIATLLYDAVISISDSVDVTLLPFSHSVIEQIEQQAADSEVVYLDKLGNTVTATEIAYNTWNTASLMKITALAAATQAVSALGTQFLTGITAVASAATILSGGKDLYKHFTAEPATSAIQGRRSVVDSDKACHLCASRILGDNIIDTINNKFREIIKNETSVFSYFEKPLDISGLHESARENLKTILTKDLEDTTRLHEKINSYLAVSYTHLTLPTILLV